jgi:hypothetical protein
MQYLVPENRILIIFGIFGRTHLLADHNTEEGQMLDILVDVASIKERILKILIILFYDNSRRENL